MKAGGSDSSYARDERVLVRWKTNSKDPTAVVLDPGTGGFVLVNDEGRRCWYESHQLRKLN